jgi:DNA-directed RNA polymerase subunit M/transcription elongation factor TFIIS
MKTKGNWVIKTSAGGYWCGNANFDPQLRKAQVYHWKEKAEEQIEVIKKRKYISSDLKFEVVAISEPKELKDTEAQWIWKEAMDCFTCSNCGYSALNDYKGDSVDSLFCPHCGKIMINSTIEED